MNTSDTRGNACTYLPLKLDGFTQIPVKVDPSRATKPK